MEGLGVKGLSVEELYSLDTQSVLKLKPVHGLIFLFHWVTRIESDSDVSELPSNIWFANQVIENACASLALLNIVLNIQDIDIGEQLSAFKEFTRDFTPPMRGVAIDNFALLRRLHNSFAKTSEMASSDLELMLNARTRNLRKSAKDGVETDEEDRFHFVAYVHNEGYLWELDGLKKAPTRLSECTRDLWVESAMPHIQQRMETHLDNEIRFNLLAVSADPKIGLQEQMYSKQAALASEDDSSRRNILQQEIENIQEGLLALEAKKAAFRQYSARRRTDYSEFCTRMLSKLADKGILEDLLS